VVVVLARAIELAHGHHHHRLARASHPIVVRRDPVARAAVLHDPHPVSGAESVWPNLAPPK
jgi:hypothetical protein